LIVNTAWAEAKRSSSAPIHPPYSSAASVFLLAKKTTKGGGFCFIAADLHDSTTHINLTISERLRVNLAMRAAPPWNVIVLVVETFVVSHKAKDQQ
jgi:hypothetical protein